MHESPVCPFTTRTSALQAWLRVTLAAFVLAVYAAIALSSGVAHADEGPSASGGESGTTGATTSSQSGSASSSSTTSSGTTSSDTTSSRTKSSRHFPRHNEPRSHITAETSASGPQDIPTTRRPGRTPVDAVVQAETPVAVETGTPQTPTPETPTLETPALDAAGEAPAAIDTTDVDPIRPTASSADVAHDSKRSTRSASAVTPKRADPPRAVPVGPTDISVGSPVDTAAIDTPASVTGPVATAASDTSGAATAIRPRLRLQLAGGLSDVATLAVSVVHSVATAVAQAFGPDQFLGVPFLLATTVANAAATVGRTLVGGPLIEDTAGPFAVTYGILDGLAFLNPTMPPAGANDPSISVTPEHPLPIILLNGTTETQGANWSVGAPVLANAGYKVYTFNFGNTTGNPNSPIQATGDIRQSGLELAAEVDRVLAETGAPRVILIGHSQGGGILPVYYINNLGGAEKVSQLIGIAPSNHGTDFNGLTGVLSLPILGPLITGFTNAIGPGLFQQTVGSPFQQEVYGNGDTRPGVLYTTIASVNDWIVTPYPHQALDGPNVTNIALQDRYPGLVTGHLNAIVSPYVWASVLDALAANPAASPALNPATVAA